MKKSGFLFLITLICFQSYSQNIFDEIINRVTNHLLETETTNENFVQHDTTLNKFGLNINAVCKVILKGGQQVDGLINLSGDGFVNGFYFEGAESEDWPFNQFMKLSLNFIRFEQQSTNNYLWFTDRRILNWPVTKDTIRIAKVLAIRSMDWNESSRMGTSIKKDFEETEKGLMLTFSKTSKLEARYILNDSLSIFQDLAPDTYIREHICPVGKMKISEIVSFELVEKPDQKWLAVIAKNRVQCDLAFKESGEYGFNQKSNWYHVIIKNFGLTQIIQNSLDLTSRISGDFGEK